VLHVAKVAGAKGWPLAFGPAAGISVAKPGILYCACTVSGLSSVVTGVFLRYCCWGGYWAALGQPPDGDTQNPGRYPSEPSRGAPELGLGRRGLLTQGALDAWKGIQF